ncbi:unnamed protein product [Schistosoma margrebowiei]|uniref:Uncharacterized protein n=1 Tax=Schistosoma margrebowiei TaxID=48269 RepID=A0A183MUU9_9TREM|nr:unnamed protein product [Schistosoma margrebowiei]
MKRLYDTTKKLPGRYSEPERLVKDKESTKIKQLCFEELLNRPAPINPPDIKAAHTDLPIDVNPPTTEWTSDKSREGKQHDLTTYQLKH